MTTQGSNITNAAWVNIVTDLTLVVGTTYTLQGTAGYPLRLVESASEPTGTSPYHILEGYKMYDYTVATGLGIWVQSTSGNSNIAVTEV